ncbi:MAG: hypothetical protein U0228_25475 [Myxococcaceae bacterium]
MRPLPLLVLLTACGPQLASVSQTDDPPRDATTAADAPLDVEIGSGGGFKIYWAVNTQLEPLADVTQPALLDKTRARVDGYFLVQLGGGLVSYWPTRPPECALNKKTDDDPSTVLTYDGVTWDAVALRAHCDGLLDAWLDQYKVDHPEFRKFTRDALQNVLHAQAFARVITNLHLADEQRAGKKLVSNQLLAEGRWHYDGPTDTLWLASLPPAQASLAAAGLSSDSIFTYQEPGMQTDNGNVISVPFADGTGACSATVPQPLNSCLPFNTRMIGLVADAYVALGAPRPKISLNLRTWTDSSPTLVGSARLQPDYSGLFFEGGTKVLETTIAGQPKIEMYADGIAWLLAHSRRDIHLLMPAFWSTADLATEATRDRLPARLKGYLLALDAEVSQRLRLPSGTHALCDSRVVLIPGAYGSPLHPQQLPIARNGGPAGTVTGQIAMLSNLRDSLCRGLP